MKKIITAINNPKLNEELKKENNFEILGKDIQYKEAILEILEKNKNADLIIINEKIPGEIRLEKLIEKIKIINENIKIIFILEKENYNLEKILIKNNILDIYYNNKINLNELINIINKKEINMQEEIIKLKKIIEEKNKKNNLIIANNFLKNRKKKIKNEILENKFIKRIIEKVKIKKYNPLKKRRREEFCRNMSTKIITFSGNYKSGKSTLALITSQYLSEKNYKVLLIDGDIEKQDLSIILRANKLKNKKIQNKNLKNNYINNNKFQKKNLYKNKYYNNKKNIKIKLIKPNNIIKKYKIKLINKENKINYYKINLLNKKINKNLYFFQGLNYLIKKEIKKNRNKIKIIINNFIEILKSEYNFIIIELSKNNIKNLNKEILKNSDINIVLTEPNLLGIREIESLLKKYIKEWKIPQKSLHIICNKKKINSINKNLISKYFSNKNKIYEIKENKFYNIFINNYFKRKILLKNKNIKKDINKFIYNVIIK